jgi:hypothetical protein
VSWYRPHLERSLELIVRAARDPGAAILDVGGGESTLVDDLLARGYRNITVPDVSQTAIGVTQKRLGRAAERVRWLVADIAEVSLEEGVLRRVARSSGVSFPEGGSAPPGLRQTSGVGDAAGSSRDCQHLRAGGAD